MPGAIETVISKADLTRVWRREELGQDGAGALEVSVVTGQGLEELRRRIVAALTARDEWRDPPAVSNMRHLGHLEDALDTVERAEHALAEGASEEVVLAELAGARRALEEITGRRSPEDLVRHIFSRFCIGK